MDTAPPRTEAQRIAKVLRDDIASGARAPGSKLPGATAAAKGEFAGVSHATITKAYAMLRDEGLVVIRRDPPQGTFVATEAERRLHPAAIVRDLAAYPSMALVADSGGELACLACGERVPRGQVNSASPHGPKCLIRRAVESVEAGRA